MGSFVFVSNDGTKRTFVYHNTARPEPGEKNQLFFSLDSIVFYQLTPIGYTGDEITHLLVFSSPEKLRLDDSLECDVTTITHAGETYTLDPALTFDLANRRLLRNTTEEMRITFEK